MQRTHNNNELSLANINEEVKLIGWVAKRRNFGAMVFIDLRDRYGITQLVFNEEISHKIKDVRNEYILSVSGKVAQRQDANPKLKTGDIEVVVNAVEIINSAKTTPLIIDNETDALEPVRLKYRYLDLRRPNMQEKIIMRSNITHAIRTYLQELDFVDIETPVLGKSTPEGARDYLVPSRNYPGEFYALPQSPQLYKQLLMISGFEKYYQIAKCFRDEDLRADRQMEFTQVDIEMAFKNEEEIQSVMEGLIKHVFSDVLNVDIQTPFKKLSWYDALNTYGSDKPDTRFDMTLIELKDIFVNTEFNVLKSAIDNNGVIKAIVVNDYADISRRNIDKLVDIAKSHGAKGILDLKYLNNQLDGRILKFFSGEEIEALEAKLNLKENDLIIIVSGDFEVSTTALGAIRLHLAKEKDLIDAKKFNFLWVNDFPLLEYDVEDQRFYARHHPFTRPKDEDVELLDTKPEAVLAYAYDLVLNGYELAGGSLRNYKKDLQNKLFEVLGFDEKQIQSQFGFFVDAFDYGTPPHGGIAIGLDRLAMLMSESETIREVIAFPKNANARCPMTDAPSKVSEEQLGELHLRVKK